MPSGKGSWKQEHQRALEKERTAASWVAWRDDRITQAAVAWVLTTVFIRFCEDNALVAPVWITGPENRRQEALDAQLAYFRAHPEDTDREWLQVAIDYLAGLPATKALVESHSALHLVSPSGDAVTELLDFWRTPPRGRHARPRPARTRRCPPGSSATCTRTCPSTRRTPTPCCRPRSSSRSSSWTAPWNQR